MLAVSFEQTPVLSHQIRTYLTIEHSSLKLSKTKPGHMEYTRSSSHRLVCSHLHQLEEALLVKVAAPEVFPFPSFAETRNQNAGPLRSPHKLKHKIMWSLALGGSN